LVKEKGMDGSIDPVEHPRAGAHRRLLVISGFCFAITVLAIFLLFAFAATAAEVVEPFLQHAQRNERGSELPMVPVFPETRGGPSPELPEIQPSAPPPSRLTTPAPAQPPEATPLRQGPRFVLRDVNIIGNTVLDEGAIRGVVDPYLGKPVTTGDLEEIRRQFTLLYINRGYINSGATIPDQNVANGVVAFRFVEGRVNDVEVSGTEHFDPEYFRSRLARGTEPPFNVESLGREQQILLQSPLVRRLNLELLPGLEPGEARLHADVLEANRFSLNAQIADDQSPTVGAVRGQLQGSAANLLGFGDILTAQYGRSQGLNDGYVGYSVPIASDDTRVSVRYDRNGVVVVTPDLSPLHVTSSFSSIGVGLSRPIYRTPEQALTVGASLERRQQQTFLLGMPFPFTAGAEPNGRTVATPLRLYQDWLDRDAEHAFAARSTFSVGLQTLGATVTDMPATGTPTAKFFSWLGQVQYVSRIYEDWESDDGFLASGELRIPVGRLRLPYLADSDTAGTVQIVPFYDFARDWNTDRPTPYPQQISGIGAGVRWYIGSGITAEFYYAKALRHVPVGTSIEDRGLYFRVTSILF
jgi:hemolysin activation/secretion protein